MNYRTFIDIGEGEFEVFLTVPEFTYELESGELFHRYKWGKIDIRNNPELYRATGNDAYRLYDLIEGLQFNQEILIRFSYVNPSTPWSELIIKGRFCSNKCEYKHDVTNKVLSVTPETVDKYTNFLANIENEVDIITGLSTAADNNLISNGGFDVWLGKDVNGVLNTAKDWTWIEYRVPSIYSPQNELKPPVGVTGTTVGSTMMGMYDGNIESKLGQQTAKVIAKGKDLSYGFKYNTVFFDATTLSTENGDYSEQKRFMDIAKKRMQRRRYVLTARKKGEIWEDEVFNFWNAAAGVWQETEVYNNYTESDTIILMPDEFQNMFSFDGTTAPLPFDAWVTIIFYPDTPLGSQIEGGKRLLVSATHVLDDVYIYADAILNKTIKIPLNLENLDRRKIFSIDKVSLRATVRLTDWEDANKDTKIYFNNDGSPNMATLVDQDKQGYGFHMHDPQGRTIPDWIEIFKNDNTISKLYDMYQGELCELTIYEGEWYRNWYPAGTKLQRIFAEATFAREVVYKEDVKIENEYEPPQPDAGWVRTDFVKEGKAQWVRIPFNGQYTTWQMGEEEFGEWWIGSPGGFRLQKRRTSKRVYPSIEQPLEFTTGIDLRDVFRNIFHVTHEDYKDKEVLSNFLWNTNEEDLSILRDNPGINYVTFKQNFLNNITCLNTYALKTTNVVVEGNEKNRLVFSFKTFFDDFRNYFKKYNLGELYYDIDDDLNLVIEHIKYKEYLATTIDIRDYLIRPNFQFSYDISQLRSKIKYTQMIAGYKDFINNIVEFPQITGDTNTEVIIYTSKLLTTDVRYCVENPNDLDNGLILINHENNVAVFATVQIAGNYEVNGNLAISSLLTNFGRYEGSWINGKINGEEMYFDNVLRVKKGEQVLLKGIVKHDYMTTNIGDGFVLSLTNDFNKLMTKVNLIYKSGFVLMASKYLASEGEEDIEIDLGTY